MKRNTRVTIFTLTLLIYFSFIVLAQVQASPSVATYDTSDNPQNEFGLGDTVRIKAYSAANSYNLFIFDSDGDLNKTIGPITTHVYLDDHTDITGKLGTWTIFLLDSEWSFRVGQYHVIPVVPLGTLGIIGICFAGLSLAKVRQKK